MASVIAELSQCFSVAQDSWCSQQRQQPCLLPFHCWLLQITSGRVFTLFSIFLMSFFFPPLLFFGPCSNTSFLVSVSDRRSLYHPAHGRRTAPVASHKMSGDSWGHSFYLILLIGFSPSCGALECTFYLNLCDCGWRRNMDERGCVESETHRKILGFEEGWCVCRCMRDGANVCGLAESPVLP